MSTPTEAGRELDAIVAEKVVGYRWVKGGTFLLDSHLSVAVLVEANGTHLDTKNLPRYTSDIAAAWEVVEKLHEMGLYVAISKDPDRFTWDVRGWNDKTNSNRFIGFAETAPLAICLAALKAVEP